MAFRKYHIFTVLMLVGLVLNVGLGTDQYPEYQRPLLVCDKESRRPGICPIYRQCPALVAPLITFAVVEMLPPDYRYQ